MSSADFFRWAVWSALAGLLLAGAVSDAHAYVKAGSTVFPGGHNVLKGTAVQDGMATSLAAAYSFRKVRSAYAGPAVKLRRTTGGTQDINFTASGDFDTAAAAAFCASTTCFIDTWYDQSGNARHAVMVTPSQQPQYIASCAGDKPCFRMTAADQYPRSSSVAWAAGKSTLSVVANRSGGTGACYWAVKGGNTFASGAANIWQASDGAATMTMAASDAGWHAAVANLDGASSIGRVDQAETAGNVPGSAAAGAAGIGPGTAGTVCDLAEVAIWDNYALTQPERTALTQNQRDYWMPLPLDSFATPAAAYSLRRLKSSYAGPAIRLRRASDNAETDINFLSFTGFTGAPIDVAAANAHCNATTCTVVAWYDQSGNARHAYLQGADVPPNFIFNCNGSLPCARTTGDQRVYTAATFTPTMPVTFGAVANRRAGTNICSWPNHYGSNYFSAWAGQPIQWVVVGGTAGYIAAIAADGAWHAGVGVVNGAASVVRIDATETTGSTTGAASASVIIPLWGQAVGTTCDATEVIYWDAYAMPVNERAALTANQRNFWAIP